jgi:hypothetical protein
MPARVYECDRSEAQALKKALDYDPYTDTNLIPPAPASADIPADKLTEDQKKELAEHEKQVKEVLDKLKSDPRADVIFARQNCSLRDGATLGLNADRMYLYINATDDVLTKAEQRFKNEFKTIKRAQKLDEDAVIAVIKKEEDQAGSGFGSIFGG